MNAATELRATLNSRIAALETEIATGKPGYIFAWFNYGIGVMVAEDGPRVVGVDLATIVRLQDRRTFNNGANVPAAIIDRKMAMRAALAMVRNTLAQMDRAIAA